MLKFKFVPKETFGWLEVWKRPVTKLGHVVLWLEQILSYEIEGDYNMRKNRFWGLAIIIGFIAALLLVVGQIPASHTAVKQLPLAVLNQDGGPVSAKMVKQLTGFTTTGGKNATTIKWTTVKSAKALKKGIDQQKYYGALVIDENFTKNVATLATAKPVQPRVTIAINQAKNATVATAVTNLFGKMTINFSTGIATQVLAQFAAHNQPVPTQVAQNLLQPIKVTTKTYHATINKPTGAMSFFQPVWMGSLLASLMLFFAANGLKKERKMTAAKVMGLQLIVGAITAWVIGFGTTGFTTWIMNYHYDNYLMLALYATLAAFAFIMLMVGVISWTGIAGMPLFVLLMLFAMPILSLAPEMLTYFYKAWVYPWLPMRFLLDGTRGIIYYHANFWTDATTGLIWVMVVGLVLLGLKNLVGMHKGALSKE